MADVWYVAVESVPETLSSLLDGRDRERRRRLVRQQDRDRYLAAWVLARLVLAQRLGGPPGSLAFDRTCRYCGGDHGKPVVDPAVDFSLSHTGGLAVVAVCERAVGVDVEDATAGREPVTAALSERERAECLDYAAFAQVWTRKEAVLKAVGKGIAVHPAAVGTSGTTLLSAPAELGRPGDFTLRDLALPAPYVGSLAVVGPLPELTVRCGSALVGAAAGQR